MKNLPLILCAGALLLTLGGCHAQSGVQSVQSADGNQSSSLDSSVNPYQSQGAQADTSEIQPEEKSSQGEEAQMVTLYIGMDGQFQQYQEPYEGTLNEQGMVPAEGVVAEMAQLTGWNLDLAGEITTGKGGITVSFGETCALFSGPPQEQKEEFHVYDSYQLDETILDSVKKTCRTGRWFRVRAIRTAWTSTTAGRTGRIWCSSTPAGPFPPPSPMSSFHRGIK